MEGALNNNPDPILLQTERIIQEGRRVMLKALDTFDNVKDQYPYFVRPKIMQTKLICVSFDPIWSGSLGPCVPA